MKITIFGMGHVGCVMAGVLAEDNHIVYCVDSDKNKIERLKAGISTIREPGLDKLIQQGHENKKLIPVYLSGPAIEDSEMIFVCVGTPSIPGGQIDLSQVRDACKEIGNHLKEHQTVVIRSTVLPHTTEDSLVPILEIYSGLKCGRDFEAYYNPEFIREGSALRDWHRYNIIGILEGKVHAQSLSKLSDLYNGAVYTLPASAAEMLKYVCNAWHALKVAFANEIGTICNKHNIDENFVMKTFFQDTCLNISEAYLTPGFAFGGSCLPKDIRALYHYGSKGVRLPLLSSILESNSEHIDRAVVNIMHYKPKRVAIIGPGFKQNVKDMRDSPYVELGKRLSQLDVHVIVLDEDDNERINHFVPGADVVVVGRVQIKDTFLGKQVIQLA